MKFYLGDVVPLSTLDWPGKIVMVVFMYGCPLNCVYCSNHQLIRVADEYSGTDTKNINGMIFKNSDFIDGVVFSGGEPFMQLTALEDMIAYAKSIGLLVGVETNGVFPERIKKVVSKNLIDALFIDIKAPFDNNTYEKICGADNQMVDSIKHSILLAGNMRKDNIIKHLEIRTTIFENINNNQSDIDKIVNAIIFADEFVLQQGIPWLSINDSIKNTNTITRDRLREMAKNVEKKNDILKIKIRTLVFGDEIIK